MLEYDKTGDISNGIEAAQKSIEESIRMNDKLQFMWEMYKMQKQIDGVNRKLDKLEERYNEHEQGLTGNA
ncbi:MULTISPECIES: hypothetical protein [Metabacillus]|jgi:hypothetical protein|uniref:Uncharacterized protein n=2 Tax=Metabacillus TaxID=2675233 RepID=A0A179SVW1_9BACI|nr:MULTISPECIES: hypothetical protein [Metabacillus]OAS85220.1 hypothetical protein A6K24_06855 [Metabacillus litoralis]QNF26115.1 hypothetical protein HUW50_00245 [Metabacillus sp. KUDC1714]